MTTEIGSFAFQTVSGTSVSVTLMVTDPCDGRLLSRATCLAQGKSITDWLEEAFPVLDIENKFYRALRERGATHYARLGDSVLALGPDAASLITSQLSWGVARAREIKAERDAESVLRYRKTYAVRRTLRYSSAWPDTYALQEAYSRNGEDGYSDWTYFSLPGEPGFAVHRDCPSLSRVFSGGEKLGSLAGHGNVLVGVSDADWDLLIAETSELEARDKERANNIDKARAERIAKLRLISIPQAALAAFIRYGGDDSAAWEQEDESAASLIRTYGDAIEAQGLAFRRISAMELPVHPPGA